MTTPNATSPATSRTGLTIRGREDLLDRLITNSFSNIIRYTETEAPVVVRLQREVPTRSSSIEDGAAASPSTGCGRSVFVASTSRVHARRADPGSA